MTLTFLFAQGIGIGYIRLLAGEYKYRESNPDRRGEPNTKISLQGEESKILNKAGI